MELFDTTAHFGKPLATHASSRNAIGRVAEVFASHVLDVDLLPVNGSQRVCPDFKNGEIKSVGKNGIVLLYKWRLEKESQTFPPSEYFYTFVRHSCPITVDNYSAIVSHFAEHPPFLLCVSLHEIVRMVRGLKPRKMNWFEKKDVDKRIGYYRKGYDQGGWQFNMSKFEVTSEHFRTCQWNGTTLGVRIKTTDGGLPLLQSKFCLSA